jgi:hypothetical protein
MVAVCVGWGCVRPGVQISPIRAKILSLLRFEICVFQMKGN